MGPDPFSPKAATWVRRLLPGAGAVGDGDFGSGQHGREAVGEAEIEEHALLDDAAHFARLEIDHEEGLLALDLALVGALLLHGGENDALAIAEADVSCTSLPEFGTSST